MPNPPRNEPQPLTAWVWTLGFLTVFALGVAALPHRDTAVYEAYRKRIASFSQAHRRGRPLVVYMGASRAYRATPTGRETEWLFEQKPEKRGVSFLKLARPRAVMEFYEPLLESILDLKPDLIVLQAETLRPDPWRWVEDARAGLRLALVGKAGGYGWHIDPPSYRNCVVRKNEGTFNRAKQNVLETFSEFDELIPEARRFFDEARARGVRIVVLEIERSLELREATNDVAARWRRQLSDELSAWPEIEMMTYAEELALDHFCDYSHFSKSGMEKFLGWLVPRIEARLGDGGKGV
jgi:hypothetical protein